MFYKKTLLNEFYNRQPKYYPEERGAPFWGGNYKPKSSNIIIDKPKPSNIIESQFINKVLNGPKISDAEGLRRAGLETDAIYKYGNTLYLAGTRGAPYGHEWRQNLKYIALPIAKDLIINKGIGHGSNLVKTNIELNKVDRVKNSLNIMKSHPEIKKAVGFSVGGLAVEELKRNYPNLQGNTYGTPHVDILGTQQKKGINRYRLGGDLLAVLDNGASTKIIPSKMYNPIAAHSFEEQGSKNFTSNGIGAYGKLNLDNSISLYQ